MEMRTMNPTQGGREYGNCGELEGRFTTKGGRSYSASASDCHVGSEPCKVSKSDFPREAGMLDFF